MPSGRSAAPRSGLAAIGRRVNVRLRDGDAELVLEGKLISVTGERRRDRGSRPPDVDRAVGFSLDAVLAARIVVDI